MFKIGINSAPRIVPAEVTETQESPVQQNLEQQSISEAKPISAANTSIRAEARFSEFAMRFQLSQQLARNESNINTGSLKQITPVDLQAPLTQTEAEQQIDNQPTYIKPFTADEARKGEILGRTLYTGDGDDQVKIYNGYDGLVHVDVNGKEAWSGTAKEFSAWTIDTGKGNDEVTNSVDFAKIETGEGDDRVKTSEAFGVRLQTGDGNDSVSDIDGSSDIDTGSGNDDVSLYGSTYSEVNTGSGDDKVELKYADGNNINTGSGNDEVSLGHYAYRDYSNYNEIHTGSGDDSVSISKGDGNLVWTEGGNDVIGLGDKTNNNEVDSGQGEDEVYNDGENNRIKG